MLELDYAPPPPDVPLKRFAVDNYLRMVTDGKLDEDAGVELINGWMVEKMPVNPRHKTCLRRFLAVLPKLDLNDLVLDSQGTVAFADSAPEPDLTLSYGPARKYDHRLPGEDDIVLVIEISDTSLEYDRTTKLAMYAAAGIPVYWVVNLIDKQIEVNTKPKAPKYAKRTVYKPGDAVPVTVAGKKRGTVAVADVIADQGLVLQEGVRDTPQFSGPVAIHSQNEGERNVKLRIGTSSFSEKAWKGRFYPKELPATQMLRYYAERFNTVEINSTFFAPPKIATLEKWAGQVPEGFQFAFKTPRQITHVQSLRNKGPAVNALWETLSTLRGRRGPLLVQLPPTLKKDLPRLRDFLDGMPPSARVTVEFRHKSWFDDEVFGLLRDRKVALCVADSDDFETPFVATADWGYLRLRREDYGTASLKKWIRKVQSQNWGESYVYFKHEELANGPRLAQQMTELNG